MYVLSIVAVAHSISVETDGDDQYGSHCDELVEGLDSDDDEACLEHDGEDGSPDHTDDADFAAFD